MREESFLDSSCFEPINGWSGRLIANSYSIVAKLHRYERSQKFRGREKYAHLILASGEIATLVNWQLGITGSFSTSSKSVHHDELRSNYLLLGQCDWLQDDRVSVFEFCIPAAHNSLSYGDHLESGIEGEDDSAIYVDKLYENRLNIGSIEMDGFQVSLSKRRTLGVRSKDKVGEEPTWITIHYHEPVMLEQAMQLPFHVRVFFELSVGRPLSMRGIGLRRYREESLVSERDDFEFYKAAGHVLEPDQGSPNVPIFKIWLPEDRELALNALRKWLQRRDDWAVTYWLASQFAHGGEEVNRSNMLLAMAWFESIPDYASDEIIERSQLKRFRKECRELDSFKELPVTEKRLNEVLNELCRLPLNERIEHAVRDVNELMGAEFLTAAFTEACKNAKKLRDKAAHGGDDVLEREFRSVVVATAAIETLALLATVRSLGVDFQKVRFITERNNPHPYSSYFCWDESFET